MPIDLGALICRDHDDLDRALVALLRSTTAAEAEPLLDALRICLGAHTAAQSTVLRDLLGPVASSRVIAENVRTILDEHRKQARELAVLGALRVGASEWQDAVLELRIAVLDHKAREEFIAVTLFDHVGPATRRAFARTYATERLRRFASLDNAAVEPPLRAIALG
jgi:hypothetical protein